MPHHRTTSRHDGIAIIGMACLFPGAADLEAYWRNILGKVDAVREPPPGWGEERYYDPADTTGDRIYTQRGGFLGELARFNPGEHGIMPSSVDGGEPDQLLALKVATDALKDAGYAAPGTDHTQTGIILGHSTYLHRGNAGVVQHGVVLDQTVELLAQLHPELDSEALKRIRATLKAKLPPFNVDVSPGLVPNVMTGRIANRLDFKGPNYLIDAACASSLLAVSAAMEELWQGRADLMLAGGVNASIPAEVDMVFCQLGALSRSSRIRPFDKDANGTLLGEGLGVVVLKRLHDALRDGDKVYCVLRGVGQSSDGRGLGLLAPRLEGEMLAIERAYRQSGVDPHSIGLIEAHGTGIPLGDRTEIAALNSLTGARRGLPAVALGSVKSMISHCIPAAGAASLIKTALALHHKVLPPTLCDAVNPALGIDETPLYINTEARPWLHSDGEPRRAGVNAFGFGGINTHAVVEEAPAGAVEPPRWLPDAGELCVVAAADRPALLAELERLAGWVEADGDYRLSDLARALAERVGEGPQRLAVVATDRTDLAKKLRQAAKALADTGKQQLQSRSGVYFRTGPAEGRLAFLFPGEGSQYLNMLGDLACRFPAVRDWLEFWDRLYRGRRDMLPSQILYPPPTGLTAEERAALEARLHGMDVGSESVFIASQALFALLGELGVEAECMVGHSTGENTALVAAGVVRHPDRDELARHILKLNQVYQALEGEGEIPTGRLLTVGAVAREEVLALVENSGGALHLAMDNCHHQAVLFGAPEAVDTAAKALSERGGLCSVLPFDRAYHTPLFGTVAKAFDALYGEMTLKAPQVPLYSCASAGLFPKGPAAIRRLAASQWSSRVRFTETVERMYADGVRTFVEVGPGGNLSSFVRDILQGRPHQALQSNHRSRSGLEQLHHLLAALFVAGRPLRLAALHEGRLATPLDLDAPPPQKRPAPVLDNTLPYIRLGEGEVAEIRGLFVSRVPGSGFRVPSSEEGAAAQPSSTRNPEPGTRNSPKAAVLQGHLALMERFLANQQTVMTAALAGKARASARGPALPPFLHRLVERSADRLVAECHLTLAENRFLQDHILSGPVSARDPALRGLAVVPLTVSLELLAEAAGLLRTRPRIVGLREVRAYNWVALDEERIALRVEAERLPVEENEERFHCRLFHGDQTMLEGEVRFGAAPPPLPVPLAPPAEPRPSRWRDDQLYSTGMFHGPLFHSVSHLAGWGEEGIDARLAPCDTAGFFRGDERPSFLFNPVLLDALGQLTAYWLSEQVGTDFNSFPSRIGRIDLFDPTPPPQPGMTLHGRLAFDPADPSYLEGTFQCRDAAGRLLIAASGWRDRYFTVPHRFYRTRSNPLEGWLSEEWSAYFGEEAVVAYLPPFAPGFLEDAGAIWKRVLAHLALSRAERADWAALPRNPRRRSEWLLGRLAAKEALRRWYLTHHGLTLHPADLPLHNDDSGRPYLDGRGLEAYGPPPQLSIAHSAGQALAAAGPWPLGCDLEPLGRIKLDSFVAGAFSAEEQRFVAGREEPALRLWCAKEAAAKAWGVGLNGRPLAFVATALDEAAGRVEVAFEGRRIEVRTVLHEGTVAAVAEGGDIALHPGPG